jgi:Ti-type conjugative transfer relaxase TraA
MRFPRPLEKIVRRGGGEILNIGKLRKGGELYYLNSVARGVEDYYTGSGEAPGYWLAGGAKNLQLESEVGEDQLRAVLNGYHPTTRQRLLNGKPTKRERVPGFDLTFRAPKSVALLHALGGKEASNQAVSAHDAAVSAALAYLERQASNARRGKGGKNRIGSKGFIGAAFRHRTSRAGDPLLHTHVLVANIVKGDDGRWGALDARQLYIQAKTAGYLYQAHLRAELSRRLGVEWGEVKNGSADLEGVSRRVVRAFSKRRGEIEAAVGEDKIGSGKATQVAALTTRKSKDYRVTPNDLVPEWRERAARLGLDDKALAGLVERMAYRAPTARQRSSIEAMLAGPNGLTEKESSFGRREAIQGFCNQLSTGMKVEEIERMADRFLASDMVVPLSARAEGLTAKESIRVSDGRVIPAGVEERRYSTNDMLAVEQAVIERAIERRVGMCGLADPEILETGLSRRPTLYPDQKAMIQRLTTSGQGVEVVVGKAGTGKTFALDAAREAWEASGHRVIGCCIAARAAEELELGSGIPSYTVRGLLQALDHPVIGGLAPGSVLVIDEAAMVGTRDLARLLEHAQSASAKVVLVGDDHQLPPIDSGGAFRGIRSRLPAIELSEVRRQPFGWEKVALDMLREGRSQDAIDAYVAHDRIVIEQSPDKTRDRLIADWWSTTDDVEPAVMLAARRSDVADLNSRARLEMKAARKLGTEELEFLGRSFAVGDRVMTLKNTRRLGVKNGNRGTVESIDAGRREVTFRRDDGRVFTLPSSYLEAGHLTHGYAMTGHKSQAMTTDKAFVLGDQTLYREWAYVALSRGRNDNRLYVVAGIDADREEVGGEIEAIKDPLKEVVAALGRSRAKDLALDSYEHGEMRNMTNAELRQQWERERSIIDDMPRSVDGHAAQLCAERQCLEEMIARQKTRKDALKQELADMGVVDRGRNRMKVKDIQGRIVDASEGTSALEASLEEIDRKMREITGAQAIREEWLLENAPKVRRLDALGRELWWREQQQAIAAEVAMPQYLVNAVGERPMKPSERGAWQDAVKAVESYRDRWGVDDSENALGDQAPMTDEQQVEREVVERSLESLTDVSHEAEVDVRERSIEL